MIDTFTGALPDGTVMRRGDCRLMLSVFAEVTTDDVASVFSWLKKWEVAAPLKAYSHLAQDEGTPAERELTLQLIKDLRQPVYDSRAVWLRDCPAVESLMVVWEEEKRHCDCAAPCDLPFLRAVWIVKPLILALPAGFIVKPPASGA